MSETEPADRKDPEVAALLRPEQPLGLPRPAYSGRSIGNLAPTLWTAVRGEPPAPETGMLAGLEGGLDPFAGGRAPGTIVVLLVDGLGWFPFARWARGAGAREEVLRKFARPITTVFPTTTTAALTSLSTGAAPSTHGLVGYRQYLPRFGAVADLLRMSPAGIPGLDLLVHRDFRPDLVTGVPTIFHRGLAGTVVSRDRFEGTGFTRILYDGAEYVPYATAADLAHQLTHLLLRDDPPPIIYSYWDELDTIQHLRGPGESRLFDLEFSHALDLVDHVAREVPGDRARTTTVILTGDHGQVPSGIDRQVRVDQMVEVAREMAHPLAGDRRAGFFAAKPGRRDMLGEALRRSLPEGTRLVSMDDALAGGLFGPAPYHPELAARLGDFLALLPAPYGLTDLPPGAAPPKRHLFGSHGGLDPEELLVPLVAAPLAEFGSPERGRRRPGQR